MMRSTDHLGVPTAVLEGNGGRGLDVYSEGQK